MSFTVERSPKKRRARRPDVAVGVDLGLTRLATPSAGQPFNNSRPLQEALRKLRRLQRQLERQRLANNRDNYLPDGCLKPSVAGWAKSKRMLHTEARRRRLHERVANLRREQAHQLTTYLTREFGVIGVEALAVKNLMANRRYPSSKTCSHCGTAKAKLALSDRVFTCHACGLAIDRDLNAALNLAQVAQQHGGGRGEDEGLAAGRANPDSQEPGCRCLVPNGSDRGGP